MLVKDGEGIQIKALSEISAKDIAFLIVSIKKFNKWNEGWKSYNQSRSVIAEVNIIAAIRSFIFLRQQGSN